MLTIQFGDPVCSECKVKAGKGNRCWVCGEPYGENQAQSLEEEKKDEQKRL